MDRGVWQATVHGVSKSWTQLSTHTHTHTHTPTSRGGASLKSGTLFAFTLGSSVN